ncbi:MAG: hypothetical protein L0H36_01800 [bacterium]|nr:hypothetical protein [bacterium]MDN5835347.1 hypothetical protein [bacterium]
MKTTPSRQAGFMNGYLISIIVLIVALLGVGGLATWAYVQYSDASTDLNSKLDIAKADARKEQADIDAEKFFEKAKEPNYAFIGPDDYGRLTFNYPKTWSAFVQKDTSGGGTYQAFLNPGVVPPISSKQQFAIRVTIEETPYDKVLRKYDNLVKAGKLKASKTSSKGHSGARLDGEFNKYIRGVAVIYKIRDKTATIQTDANTFKPDYEKLIKTIDFND